MPLVNIGVPGDSGVGGFMTPTTAEIRANPVTVVPPAESGAALFHFSRKLQFETDCADVHTALQSESPGFVLIDVRGRQAYSRGHVPKAVNIPHSILTAERLQA